MARKKQSTAPKHETLRRIISFNSEHNPTQNELIGWLIHEQDRLIEYAEGIIAFLDKIAGVDIAELKERGLITKADYIHCVRAGKAKQLIVNLLDTIDASAEILEGQKSIAVSNAFTQGVRLGLLHQTLTSLVDGRYQAKWTATEVKRSGARTTNERHTKLHPIFQQEVNELRASADDPGYLKACRIVAERHEKSFQTVYDNTENPLPNKRGPRKKR